MSQSRSEVRADLGPLAFEINHHHQLGQAATRKGLEHYVQAGQALLKAKEAVGRGWLKWVKEEVTVSRTQAYRYMELAKVAANLPVTGNLEDEWRIISGNEPPAEERQGADNPDGTAGVIKQTSPQPVQKRTAPRPELVTPKDGGLPQPADAPPPLRQYVLNVPTSDYADLERLVEEAGHALMLHDEAAIVLESLRRLTRCLMEGHCA